jgi:ATP-binding cassette subfamily C protein CydD
MQINGAPRYFVQLQWVIQPPALPATSLDRKAFLKAALSPAGRFARLASAAMAFDTLAAVCFAAGLTGAVARLPGGAAKLGPWLILLTMAALARAACGWAAMRWAARGVQRVKSALRRRVIQAALGARACRGLAGEAGAAAIDEIEALDGYVVRYVPARAAAVFGPLIILAFAAWASPIGAALLLATLVPFVVLMILAGTAAAEASKHQFDALAKLSSPTGCAPCPCCWPSRPKTAQRLRWRARLDRSARARSVY